MPSLIVTFLGLKVNRKFLYSGYWTMNTDLTLARHFRLGVFPIHNLCGMKAWCYITLMSSLKVYVKVLSLYLRCYSFYSGHLVILTMTHTALGPSQSLILLINKGAHI